jgi:hypothetical protein
MSNSKTELRGPILVVAASSIAAFVFFLYTGKAGDCKPDAIDWQCRLGRFVGILDGLAAAMAVILVGAIYLTILYFRRERQAGAEQKNGTDHA